MVLQTKDTVTEDDPFYLIGTYFFTLENYSRDLNSGRRDAAIRLFVR
jgi:hypothetical protein